MFSFRINKKGFCMQGTDYKTGLGWSDITQNGPLNGKCTCLKIRAKMGTHHLCNINAQLYFSASYFCSTKYRFSSV